MLRTTAQTVRRYVRLANAGRCWCMRARERENERVVVCWSATPGRGGECALCMRALRMNLCGNFVLDKFAALRCAHLNVRVCMCVCASESVLCRCSVHNICMHNGYRRVIVRTSLAPCIGMHQKARNPNASQPGSTTICACSYVHDHA